MDVEDDEIISEEDEKINENDKTNLSLVCILEKERKFKVENKFVINFFINRIC